jgi:hypothetical protein
MVVNATSLMSRDRPTLLDGWFTEGFDTKDLQEAKALLQELP